MTTHKLRLTADQRSVLDVTYAAFRQEADWPTYQYVDKTLDARGIDLTTTLREFPEGLVRPLGSGGARPQSGDQVRLTLAGVAQGGGLPDVDLFIRVLQWLVEQERAFRPPPSTSEELRLHSSDIRRAVGYADQPPEEAVARLRLLIEQESRIYSSMGYQESPGQWDLTVSPEIRRFRGVHTFDDYLDRVARLDADERPRLMTQSPSGARRTAPTAGLHPVQQNVEARLSGLHPEVVRAAGPLYLDGHLASAIFEAFKAIEVRVRRLSGLRASGRDLMARAFRESDPPLALNRGETVVDGDEQEDFKLIFMGAMQGIRNPKAHDDVFQEDAERTLDYLSFASLLMRRLDDAEAILGREP